MQCSGGWRLCPWLFRIEVISGYREGQNTGTVKTVARRSKGKTTSQRALTEEAPEFETADEAREYIKKIQEIFYNMTSGYSVPGSVMSGLYENTAYFRIGDTSRPENTATKVVIRGGGLDYEDPGRKIARYPADYTFRLIDLVVRK